MNPDKKQEVINRLTEIRDYCKNNCSQLERWPSYFDRRFLEFLSYMELLPDVYPETVLELGCGVGYQSAFLAQIAKKVVATDLPDEDMATHTPGMIQAKSLHQQLNISNVELLGCSAESLPFPDNSFDMVYSSHVLEHIPDQDKALREIYRVLKPGGIHFCVVPASFEKVYAFFNYYVYLTQRAFYHLLNKLKTSKVSQGSNANEDHESSTLKSSMQSQLKYFPFPPPHGAYPNFIAELKNWTPSKWRKKIENGAPFKFLSQTTTQYFPFMPILGNFSPVTGTKMHATSRLLERKTGKYYLMQMTGINTVMIFEKPQ
ncbi:hypothetical protein BH11BAC2_BH11BAC2_04440 [soil metagenome]